MKPTVLITGASSGIGLATVQYFQSQGWQVAATLRNPAAFGELNALPNVQCFQLDVLNPTTIAAAVENTIAVFGGIDVLINNAGYGTTGPFEAATPEQIHNQFDTNVFGLMRVTRAVLPHFRAKRRGIIINISSMGGRITFPLYSLYHSTKWAVEGFSESLHYELKPFNIKVKLIEPGAIKTDFYQRSQVVFQAPELTAYQDYQQRVLNKIQTISKNAPGPELVAKIIFRAATDQRDHLRYSVGQEAPLLLFLRRLIPDAWFFAIIRRSLELRD
jgi:NAD(P)-dependent dehydrogenase (short-subunit alcohol dehydrogenase family)